MRQIILDDEVLAAASAESIVQITTQILARNPELRAYALGVTDAIREKSPAWTYCAVLAQVVGCIAMGIQDQRPEADRDTTHDYHRNQAIG